MRQYCINLYGIVLYCDLSLIHRLLCFLPRAELKVVKLGEKDAFSAKMA